MENKKITKKITLGLICLSVLVLIGLSIYQHFLLRNLSPVENSEMALNEDTSGNPPSISVDIAQQYPGENTPPLSAELKQSYTGDIEALEEQLEETEEELDEAHQQLADEAERKKELRQKELELQKQYASDPNFRSYVRASIANQYADIFKELNLSPEDLERLKDLITDQQMGYYEISMDAQSASSEDEKTALQKRMDELKEKEETELRELLGNDDYEKYTRYTERSNERSAVSSFAESLSSEDTLTDDQKQDLVDLMYKEREDVFSETSFDSSSIATITSEMNEEGIEKRINRTKEIDERSLQKAGRILNDSQLEEFKKYLENRRERMEMSLKLSTQ